MTRHIRTAVIPAGGRGTRMMPASSAIPKELFPVGRKPAIQWAINEALDAGIEQILVVSSSRKPSIAAYFLGDRQTDTVFGRASWRRRNILPNSQVRIVNQPTARGLGDAVHIAHLALGSEPFALLLPDEILLGGSRLLRVMLDDYERTGDSGVSLLQVDQSEIGSYGCAVVDSNSYGDERLRVSACIEKPDPSTAPSCFALSGRYVLGSDVLDLIGEVKPDRRGEVQLTSALNRAASTFGLAGFVVREEDGRVDVGNWQGWQEANVRCFSKGVTIRMPAAARNLRNSRVMTIGDPAKTTHAAEGAPSPVQSLRQDLNGHLGVAG